MKHGFCFLVVLGLIGLGAAQAQTFSKTETIEYHDDTALWVVGQVKRTTTNGVETSRTEFTPQAQPWKDHSFGKLQDIKGYWADGSLNTVTDGNGNTTWLGDYHRGIPRLIGYPATPESPGGTTQSAVVNDHGLITSVTDENGFATGYGYDAMGRLASIVYPAGDSVAYNNTIREFRPLTTSDWVPPGHTAGQWRQYVATGNHVTLTYYDAMWRPMLVHEYDASNVGPTLRSTSKSYDSNGRLAFESYPSSSLIPALQGTTTRYDALDRVTQVEQSSELGTLVTATEYLAGFQTRVTNPRGHATVIQYQVFDQPTTEAPSGITMPEGAATEIYRDVFGKPTRLRRRNADATLAIDRHFVYDANQQLCKVIEPENGSTIMGYDAAGNLAWSASGHVLPDAGNCNYDEGYWRGRRVDRTYDARNRLKTLAFPDGLGNQTWTYTPDGLPASITTNNSNGGEQVVNTYSYNKRRLLITESMTQPGWDSWGIGHGYNANGHLQGQSYPTGLYVDHAPNALGQPTKAGTYATGVRYYPNGGIAQFTYGNGIVHTMTQNARQLPARSTDAGSALDLAYTYDPNANVSSIWDHAQDNGNGFYGRWMVYDGLDRLTDVGSCSFGGDCWHRFTYDALDNIKSWKLGGVKDFANYYYEPGTNRLTSIQNSAGASVVGLGYDVQGNLANKNGQLYAFDFGNRLRYASGQESYRYDGHGRRVTSFTPWPAHIPALSQYSQAGQLMFGWKGGANETTQEHVYLAGSLVATIEHAWPSNATLATKYQHTDALGSPVAVTNESGQVIDRTQYEPYGAAIGKPAYDGVGYTGHVQDGATGLTYMQQRYYDPSIGRFLSVDPVTADGKTGGNFNRYWYANNNPYKFTDPDGRLGVTASGCETPRVLPIAPTTVTRPTASGVVTSGFGNRVHPVTGQVKLHNGTDFKAKIGTEIKSTETGRVSSLPSGGPGGNQILVSNNSGSMSGYAHTAAVSGLKTGDVVEKGQTIGRSDGSGRITGPHLHYTYRPGRFDAPATLQTKPVDPVNTQLKDIR